jgi:hypothetical protein
MRCLPDGTLDAGIGDGTATTWAPGAPAPVPLGRGGVNGFLHGSAFGSAPREGFPGFQPCTEPWPTYLHDTDFQVDHMAAGGSNWLASNSKGIIGHVPFGYESWKAHDVGPDGTMILVLNGVFKVFWANPSIAGQDEFVGVAIRACMGCVVTTDRLGNVTVISDNGIQVTPETLPGPKHGVTVIGRGWLMYLHERTGRLVVHTFTNATRGYVVAHYKGELFGEGVILPDNRALFYWCDGAQEQGMDGDLHRMEIERIGLGMESLETPVVEPPPVIEPPPIIIVPPDPPIIDPKPPIEPPIEPEEPEMPLKPENRVRYENALADCAVIHLKIGEEDALTDQTRQEFWQGIHEEGDRYERTPELSWSGRAMSLAGCNRYGAASVTLPQEGVMDPWFDAIAEIDAVELQRK